MDFAENARRLEIDEDQYRSLVATFIRHARTDLDSIERSIAAGDFEQVRRDAHSLKGASGSLELEEIYGASTSISPLAIDRRSEAILEHVVTIRTHVEALEHALGSADEAEES